jgi:hypothetical protein
MGKKKARQGSQRSPSPAEPQSPLSQSDDPSVEEALRQSSPKEQKRNLREQARSLHEKDWLAPAGSVAEEQFLTRWAKHGLSQNDRELIYKWIHSPDESAKRNTLFWQSAKNSVLGPVVYETAMERQRMLDDKEWLVACFTAQGLRQKEIAELTHIGVRMVDNIIRSLKDKITQELKCDIEPDGLIQIARWFLGM